jgi:hypothetical protein
MKPVSLSKIANANMLSTSSYKPNHLTVSKKSVVVKISTNEANFLQTGSKAKFKTSKNSPERRDERNFSEEKNKTVKVNANHHISNSLATVNSSIGNHNYSSKPEFNEIEYFKSKLAKNKGNGVNLNYTKGDSLLINKQNISQVTSILSLIIRVL